MVPGQGGGLGVLRSGAAYVLALAASTAQSASPRTLDLRGDARQGPAVVYGSGREGAAATIRNTCEKVLDVPAVAVAAAEIMEPGTWRLAETWAQRPLVLVGSVVDNEAVFALHSRYLAGVNAAYPGPGRYVLRTLFSPFRRGADIVLVGAADEAGVKAGVEAFARAMTESKGAMGPTVELGDAGGPSKDSASGGTEFPRAAYRHYWYGNTAAGKKARELLLGELAARPNGLWGFDKAGHYDWERRYRPLRQVQVSGLLSEEEERQVDQRLTQNMLENSDWALEACLRTQVGDLPARASRHQISALAGAFLVLDYLVHVGTVPAPQRESVEQAYSRILGHVHSYVEGGHFCSPITGTEGAETLNIMADMVLYHGDGRIVRDGTLRRMADLLLSAKDNLGCHACDDSYIGCRPGCHFARSAGGATWLWAGHFYRDGGYRWLLENVHAFLTHFQVARPPEPTALLAGIPATEPSRYTGVDVQPLAPAWYGRCTERVADEAAVPVKIPYERTFTRAAFRDGFAREDAYLLLQGVDRGSINANYAYQANAVTRYTELGSLLLFSNSLKHTGWSQNVVSVSRGALDPQSTASELEAVLNAPFMAALRSRHERHGGMNWVRTLVRRRHGYTLVLDRLTALEDDTYNLTCRWRSYHLGEQRGAAEFEAVDGQRGVHFRIASAVPVDWQVRTEKSDGAARPTVVRQLRRERLGAGESAGFQNLLYASDAAHPRQFEVRSLSLTSALVRGRTEAAEELTAAGTDDIALGTCNGTAALWYVSEHGLALDGARRIALPSGLAIAAGTPFEIVLDGTNGEGWIEVSAAAVLTVSVATADEDALRIDGRTAPNEMRLTPGRHALHLTDHGKVFSAVRRELETRWEQQPAAGSPVTPSMPDPRLEPLATRWEHQGEQPPFREHGNVRIWGEPKPDIGVAETWTNRLVGPPAGFGWHGSERAGWSPGTQGAIFMDLGEPVDIADIELVRSRRYRTEAGAFNPVEFAFDVVLSNDEFARDVRAFSVEQPHYGIFRLENAHYTHTRRFPLLTVPVNQRARYVKLVPRRVRDIKSPPADYYGTYRDGETSFMEITVHRARREARRKARIWALPDMAGGTLLVEAGEHLTALDADGNTRWQQRSDTAPAAPSQIADIDGDGEHELLVFTLAETLSVYDLTTGRRELLFDLDAQADTPKVAVSSHTQLRPNAFCAWHSDPEGRMEVAFFPHYAYGRITPGPDRRYQPIEYRTTMRSAKVAFEVPDVTGDGRPELAVVGAYGSRFGIIPSEAPLDDGRLGPYLASAALTGYNSGNMELQLYWDGAVVRDAEGRWLGTAAVNPGGIDFFAHPGFKPAWSHFHHPENRCFTLSDLDRDGVPELLLGRADGCVVAYNARDGATSARVTLDGELRCLRPWAAGVVAGTEHGLWVLGHDLQPVAFRAGAVEDVALLPRGATPTLLAAALSDGRVQAFSLGNDSR